MTDTPTRQRTLTASDIGGAAILLEIGAEFEVIDPLQRGEVVDAGAAARRVGIRPEVMEGYLRTLERLGLAAAANGGTTSGGQDAHDAASFT